MLKLYYSPGACSLAVHIVLEEINEPYETELISSMDGSTKKASYLKINPKGRVPVLCIDDTIMTEVAAIMTYLALAHPTAKMLANTPIALARAIEWMNWLSTIHSSMVASIWRSERFSDDESIHPILQAKGLTNLAEAYGLIDEKLKDKQWAIEDHYSIVDPYLLVFFRWGNRLGLNMQNYTHWAQHTAALENRRAVQIVLDIEGITI